jgi:hypothetical protein
MTTMTRMPALSLEDLMADLQLKQNLKQDVVLPARALASVEGKLLVRGQDVIVNDAGVTDVNGAYRMTDTFLQGVASKLNIPIKYLRRMQAERLDLFDGNVNGWLTGSRIRRKADGTVEQDHAGDPRSFLVRLYLDQNGGVGEARSLQSDSYKVTHYIDTVMALLDGFNRAGLSGQVEVQGQVTEERLHLLIKAPQITELAPELLAGYRSPFHGQYSGDNGDTPPIVSAGLYVSDSEVGQGKWSVTPRLEVEACSNGWLLTHDAIASVHLGGRLDEGVINWSDETERTNRELLASKTRDAVSTFLDVEYMRTALAALTEQASRPVAEPAAAIQAVSKRLSYTEEQQAGIMQAFLLGGQATAGGVAQAMTAYAQTVADFDQRMEIEADAIGAMSLV